MIKMSHCYLLNQLDLELYSSKAFFTANLITKNKPIKNKPRKINMGMQNNKSNIYPPPYLRIYRKFI